MKAVIGAFAICEALGIQSGAAFCMEFSQDGGSVMPAAMRQGKTAPDERGVLNRLKNPPFRHRRATKA
jgi:hypothetical protein